MYRQVFQSMEIPLITVDDFHKLTDENLVKYFLVIYEKFIELLNQTIKLNNLLTNSKKNVKKFQFNCFKIKM